MSQFGSEFWEQHPRSYCMFEIMNIVVTKLIYMMLFCLSTSIEVSGIWNEQWQGMLDEIDGIMDISKMSATQDCSAVRFYLATRSTTYKNVEVFTGSWKSLGAAGLDRDKTMIVGVHGWINNHSSPAMEILKEGAKGRDFAYLGVDWSDDTMTLNYPRVARRVRAIGYCLADFLYFLISENGMRLNNIHLVGHSLGAHVCGFAGKRFQDKYDLTLYRITCLDPAGPLFNYNEAKARLDKTDANFVDCIFTSRYLYGHIEPIGLANFMINDGIVVQPPCAMKDLLTGFLCSHVSAVWYFAASFNVTNIFEAESCIDENGVEKYCNGALMGFPASKKIYFHEVYLRVNSDYPYARKVVRLY